MAFLSALDVMGDKVPDELSHFESLSTADVSSVIRLRYNVTKLIEQKIINRISMDEGSESPKICSSLTKNQAAVLEYICQV